MGCIFLSMSMCDHVVCRIWSLPDSYIGQSQYKCFHSFTVSGKGAGPFENIHQIFFQEHMGLWLIALLRNNYWRSVSCRRDKFEEDTYFPINCKTHSLPRFDLRQKIFVFFLNFLFMMFQIVYLFRTYQWILRPYLVQIFCLPPTRKL